MPNKADWLDGRWSGVGYAEDDERRGNTGVPMETLREVGKRIDHRCRRTSPRTRRL